MALLPASGCRAARGRRRVCMGIGYGPITAASSELLARTTPPDRMALTFSIKQTGVPAGAALAGALLPAARCWRSDWRAAFLVVAAAGVVVVAVSAQPTRRALDLRNPGSHGPSRCAPSSPRFELIVRTPAPARALADRLRLCRRPGLPVELPGGLSDGAAAVVAGSGWVSAHLRHCGRCAWPDDLGRARRPHPVGDPRPGRDRRRSPAFAASALALAGPAWPRWAVLPSWPRSTAASAIGWNGVQLSELARRGAAGRRRRRDGRVGFITFGGVMAGPAAVRCAGRRNRGLPHRVLRCAPLVSGATAAVLLVRATA